MTDSEFGAAHDEFLRCRENGYGDGLYRTGDWSHRPATIINWKECAACHRLFTHSEMHATTPEVCRGCGEVAVQP